MGAEACASTARRALVGRSAGRRRTPGRMSSALHARSDAPQRPMTHLFLKCWVCLGALRSNHVREKTGGKVGDAPKTSAPEPLAVEANTRAEATLLQAQQERNNNKRDTH